MEKIKTLYHSDDELVDMIRETLESGAVSRGALIMVLEILTDELMEDGLTEEE